MTRLVLAAALTTGAFCAVFAGVIDLITDTLSFRQVIIAGGISGFLGSLVAHFALRRRRGDGR